MVEREERRLIDLLVLRHEVHKVLVDRPIQEHQGIDVQAEHEKVMLEGWAFRCAHGFAVEGCEIEEMNGTARENEVRLVRDAERMQAGYA